MTVETWQPGTAYSTGEIVRPTGAGTVVAGVIDNPDYESGDTDWTKPAGWDIANVPAEAFDGDWRARFQHQGAPSTMPNDTELAVFPGQEVTAQCFLRTVGAGAGAVGIEWLDDVSASLGYSYADVQEAVGYWIRSAVTAKAPRDAAFFRIVQYAETTTGGDEVYFDNNTVTYAYNAGALALLYKATTGGVSDVNEPVWPTAASSTVGDGTVTWTALDANRVSWEANHVLVSGSVEPTWPSVPGAFVPDGTIAWEAISQRVEDERCPQSTVVVTGASKIFAGNSDVIAFSATINPLDWSTREDGGYLPFGLRKYGDMPVTALALYRENMAAFNVKGMQLWEIDEDPANMALLDAVPIGCSYSKTLQPVMNDLLFLSSAGIRNVATAAASENLEAGDMGKQVDPLVRQFLAGISAEPRALYYPSEGQYWLILESDVIVMTFNGSKPSWSRYTFPWAIEGWTLLGEDLYLRAGDLVVKLDEDALVDAGDVEFTGTIQWPYLAFGTPGSNKMMHGFDLTAEGEVTVSVGYSQNNPAQFTTGYLIEDADTLEGGIIGMPLMAPTFSFKLVFSGNQTWKWYSSNIYVDDTGMPG